MAGQQTLEQRAEESSDVMPDDWEPTPEERGDVILTDDFVPRETAEPTAEPEVTEEEVAVSLGKEPEAKAEPEVEAPAEPEAEAPAEPEAEAEEDTQKPHLVPQIRLSKEIERRKAIEAENVRLRQEAEANQTAPDKAAQEIQEKMRKLVSDEHEAILKGDTDRANALRNEHSDLQMELMRQSMSEVQMAATQETKAELAVEAAVAELEKAYPVFDPSSETFNNDLLQDVLRDRDAFYHAGTPMADALRRAVQITVALNGLDAAPKQEQKEEVKEEPKVASSPKEEEALKRKLDVAKQQPPALRGENTNAHGEQALNIEELSEEDFDALPEATIKRLRGDL